MKDSRNAEMIARAQRYFNELYPKPDPKLFEWLEIHYPKGLEVLRIKDRFTFETKMFTKHVDRFCDDFEKFSQMPEAERIKILEQKVNEMGLISRRMEINQKVMDEFKLDDGEDR
jgi:hypothetical protein